MHRINMDLKLVLLLAARFISMLILRYIVARDVDRE